MADDPLWSSQKNRTRSSIIAEVLEVARYGALKTHIMYAVSLSFSQLNRYLSFLLDRNLLEAVETSEKTTYKTTDKGSRYLRSYRRIMKLLKEGKGKNPKEANSFHLIKRGSRVIIAE